MSQQKDHYDHLLAQHYTWMFGAPFDHKVKEQADLLREAGITNPGLSVDLGCGSGFQTIALAELGARKVHALDTSGALLTELAEHIGARPIVTHEADLMTFDDLVREPADTIVCMGDTLTHLENRDDVTRLSAKASAALRAGGHVVLSWRDLSSPPQGLDRFIPVRNAADKVMVCFLEDHGETVLVHDIVHVRISGGWDLQKSSYPKLKLSPAWVRSALQDVGFTPTFERNVRGMTVLAARR